MPNITQVNLTNGVPSGPAGASTASTIDALMALIGEVQASPTALTALDRLKTIAAAITTATVGTTVPGTEAAQMVGMQGAAAMVPLKVTNTPLTNFGAGEYETVAASVTAQPLGATGVTGDYISGILVIPATTSPGLVTLLDNAISIPVFVGGASSVSNLVPFFIPLGMISVSGAWKITTGTNVSCIGIGNFT